MDARDKLRRYLEQRRDLGESELILDSMTVEEVLRTIGAVGRSDRAVAPASARDVGDSGDWRAALASPALPEPANVVRGAQSSGLVVGGGTDELFNSDIMRHTSLKTIAAAVEACTRCPLYKTANNGVPRGRQRDAAPGVGRRSARTYEGGNGTAVRRARWSALREEPRSG